MNDEEKLRQNSNNVIINVVTDIDDIMLYNRSWYSWNEFTHHYQGIRIWREVDMAHQKVLYAAFGHM